MKLMKKDMPKKIQSKHSIFDDMQLQLYFIWYTWRQVFYVTIIIIDQLEIIAITIGFSNASSEV